MIRTVIGIATAALCFSLSAAASAEDRGWYVGVSGGKSQLDVSKSAYDQAVELSFAEAGAPVISGSSTFDASAASRSVFAGYRFSRYFSVEASYVDFGVQEYRSSGMADPPGPIASVPATFNTDFAVDGFTLAGIGRLPLGERFDAHAGLGVLFADSKVRNAATLGTDGGRDEISANSREIFWSAGAAFDLNSRLSLSLDWCGYQNVGDENETGEADLATVNLAAIFRF